MKNYKLHSLIIHLNREEHACFTAHGDGTYFYTWLYLEDLCNTQMRTFLSCKQFVWKISSSNLKAGAAMRLWVIQGHVEEESGIGSVHICRNVVMDSSSWKRIPDHIAARTI